MQQQQTSTLALPMSQIWVATRLCGWARLCQSGSLGGVWLSRASLESLATKILFWCASLPGLAATMFRCASLSGLAAWKCVRSGWPCCFGCQLLGIRLWAILASQCRVFGQTWLAFMGCVGRKGMKNTFPVRASSLLCEASVGDKRGF